MQATIHKESEPNMLFISTFLGIYLIAQPSIFINHSNMVLVEGTALIDSRNYLENNKQNTNSPLSNSKIIAIKGKVEAKDRSSKILLKEIGQELINTSTNKKGEFSFQLENGIYTFFIVKKDYAYLNRFDGYGYFESTKVSSATKNLILLDEEKALN